MPLSGKCGRVWITMVGGVFFFLITKIRNKLTLPIRKQRQQMGQDSLKEKGTTRLFFFQKEGLQKSPPI